MLAGLSSSIWTALVGLAVVPFYLKYLGIDAYGLIGFFMTTQAVLSLLDMGMAPTINREVARCAGAGNIQEAGTLLHSLAIIYWSMAFVIALLVVALAPLIAEFWLQSNRLSPQTISHAVMLMGIVVACRWPVGLYQGALIGAQRLTVSSGISILMVTISSLGAVLILAFISPTIEAFFVWQACVSFFYAVTVRFAAWKVLVRRRNLSFDIDNIKRIWRFSAQAGLIALFGLVLTQLDKIILSKTLGLNGYGHYMLATVCASSIYILVNPIFNIAYPKFSNLVAQEKNVDLLGHYHMISRLLATMVFPTAMLAILLSKELITLWTGNIAIAVNVAPLVSFLVFGYALHGIMHMPYALMLAYGEVRLVYLIYIPLAILMLPLTTILSINYGAFGGAFAQLLLFVFYTLLGTLVIHKHFLKGSASKWLLHDVGEPLGVSILLGVLGYFLLQILGQGIYLKLFLGVFLWMITIVIGVLTSKVLRPHFFKYLRLGSLTLKRK